MKIVDFRVFALSRRLHPAFMAKVGWVGMWTEGAERRTLELATTWFKKRCDVFGYPGVLKAVRHTFCPSTKVPKSPEQFRAAFRKHVLEPTRAIWRARSDILDFTTAALRANRTRTSSPLSWSSRDSTNSAAATS